MRKVILLISLFFLAVTVNAQMLNTFSLGSDSSETYYKGLLGANVGFHFRQSFIDTAAANAYSSGRLKNIAGTIIRTGNILWLRDADADQWIQTSSGLFDATVNFSVNADPNDPGTTFSPNTPNASTVIYVSTIDGSQWTFNGVVYVAYRPLAWAINGNAGIDPATNFLGTTDVQDFPMRAGNFELMRLKAGIKAIQMLGGDATGVQSLAMVNSTAIGDNSVAFGGGYAAGTESTAFGNSQAWEDNSTAMAASICRAQNAVSMGIGNIQKSFAGTVVGSFNDSTASADIGDFNPLNRVFQVGNGTANNARSNAMTILQNGNTIIGGTSSMSGYPFEVQGSSRVWGTFEVGGNHYLDGIPSSHNATDSMLVMDASTRQVGFRPIPTDGGTSPAGSNTQIQYNNSGAFGASSNLTFNGSNLGITGGATWTTLLANTSFNTTSPQLQFGSFLGQPYSLNNGFISENAYFNGSSWMRNATGYAGGFQFYNGQVLIHNINTGTGAFTQAVQMKVDYTGAFGLGVSIASAPNDYTGANFYHSASGSIGIGTTTPDASAVLDVQSTTQGVAIPRMTATQASAISSPIDALMIYVTSTNGTFTAVGFWGREAGAWIKL